MSKTTMMRRTLGVLLLLLAIGLTTCQALVVSGKPPQRQAGLVAGERLA